MVGSTKITQARLREALDYNVGTGIFVWKSSRRGCRVGERAGTVTINGYRYIQLDGRKYRSARLGFMYVEGYFPENDVDHINRVKDDDRWVNLRHVSRQCNMRNSGRRINNTSGITGVHWNNRNNKWHARIMINYKHKHLGLFRSFKEAVKARWEAEVANNWAGCNDSSDAFGYLHGGSNANV